MLLQIFIMLMIIPSYLLINMMANIPFSRYRPPYPSMYIYASLPILPLSRIASAVHHYIFHFPKPHIPSHQYHEILHSHIHFFSTFNQHHLFNDQQMQLSCWMLLVSQSMNPITCQAASNYNVFLKNAFFWWKRYVFSPICKEYTDHHGWRFIKKTFIL